MVSIIVPKNIFLQENVSVMTNSYINLAPVTKHLLIINVLCFAATYLLPKIGVDMYSLFALHYWKASDFHLYQVVTYMFLHGGLQHIFFNMFAVYMFGQTIEYALGAKKYLILYFAAGIGAALLQELTWIWEVREFAAETARVYSEFSTAGGVMLPDGTLLQSIDEYASWVGEQYSQLLTVGASGAVFGLLVAYAMLYPDSLMYVMFVPVPVKAKYVMVGYAAIELFAGVANFSWDNIAHFAHLGGAIVGFLLIWFWRKKGELR